MHRLSLSILSGLLLIGVTGAAPSASLPGRNVLLLFQDAPTIPFTVALTEGLRSALQQAEGVHVYVEHLDTTRFPQRSFQEELRGWLRSKYAQIRPDLIVAVAPGALTFATRPEPLWPGVPIVFCAIDDVSARDFSGLPGVTGVVHDPPIRETMELALRLLPDARRLALVGGAAPGDMPWERVMREDAAALRGRVELVDLFRLPMSDLLERLGHLPPRTPVLGVSFYRDGAGRSWTGPEVLRAMEPVAPGPVFTIHDFLVGRGAIGGVTLDFSGIGAQAGRLALRVMSGEHPSTGDFESAGPGRVLLDGRLLDRWGIPDHLVPAGAEVRFRRPPAWVEYPRATWAVALALLLQGLLIAGLLFERRRRRLAERTAAESQAAVAHMNRVSAVSELAGALAHEINTPLASILNNARAARRFLAMRDAPVDPEVQDSLLAIESEGERAGQVIRRLRGMLRRETAQAERLDPAEVVQEAVALVEPQARRHEVAVQTAVSPGTPSVDADRVQILQVVLNLLLNALEAVAGLPTDRRRVRATVAPDGDGVRISVADGGAGFPPAIRARLFEPFFTTKASGLGMGLSISRSIVEHYQGRIWVDDANDGSVIHVHLPAAREPPKSGPAQ